MNEKRTKAPEITGMKLIEMLLSMEGEHSIKTYVMELSGERKRLCGVRIDNRPIQLNWPFLHPAFVMAFREIGMIGPDEMFAADGEYLAVTYPMVSPGTFTELAVVPEGGFFLITEKVGGQDRERRVRLFAGETIYAALRNYISGKSAIDAIYAEEPTLDSLINYPGKKPRGILAGK